jgi:hypothetical protein
MVDPSAEAPFVIITLVQASAGQRFAIRQTARTDSKKAFFMLAVFLRKSESVFNFVLPQR